MRPDVEEVRNFYKTQLGGVARRLLVHRIRALWPDVRGQTVLGLGYAAPFMRPFLPEAERVIAVMPEDQGATRWPLEGPSRVILASETELPLRDASVHKVLAVHSLEMAGSPRPLLREIWRVLAPEGKLLLVVPNRRGLWARFDSTPFGHGRPYSRGQLERLLDSAMFAPAGWSPTLFMPPLGWRIVLNTAVGLERAGSYAWPRFCGMLVVEAQKHLYAPIMAPAREARRQLRTVRNRAFRGMEVQAETIGPRMMTTPIDCATVSHSQSSNQPSQGSANQHNVPSRAQAPCLQPKTGEQR